MITFVATVAMAQAKDAPVPVANNSCLRALELKSKISQAVKILVTKDGRELKMRRATAHDVPAVTQLTHKAFLTWQKDGLKLSPMFQNEEKTASYLIEGGFVVEDAHSIVGTFTIEDGAITVAPDKSLVLREAQGQLTDFRPLELNTSDVANLSQSHVLVFKKLAVDPEFAKLGLGSLMYNVAENLARDSGYDFMALETVREAKWLYDWYLSLGFKQAGVHLYSGSSLETVLMTKSLSGSEP
jgi:predicted N-acetyltransferase YhbS